MNDLLPGSSRTSFACVLAFVGLLAMAGGWFLPWVAELDVQGMAFSRDDLRRMEDEAKREGIPDDVTAVVRSMLEKEAVSGRDLGVVCAYWLDKERERGGIDPKEERGFTIGVAVLRYGPFALAAVAGLLLLRGLRKPAFPVGALVLTAAILVGGFAALVWIGASQTAKESVQQDPRVLGVGVYGIVFGGALAFLGGLFAVRTSTWWKVYLLTILLVVGTVRRDSVATRVDAGGQSLAGAGDAAVERLDQRVEPRHHVGLREDAVAVARLEVGHLGRRVRQAPRAARVLPERRRQLVQAAHLAPSPRQPVQHRMQPRVEVVHPVEVERVLQQAQPRLAVGPVRHLLDHRPPHEPEEHDPVAPVGQALAADHAPEAHVGQDRRVALEGAGPRRVDRRRREQTVALEHVRDHLPVARLEDEERGHRVR